MRAALRARRRALGPAARRRAALALARRLWQSAAIRQARHIALYLACDGEIDPAGFARQAARRGKIVWLPVLKGGLAGGLRFTRWQTGGRRYRNRFGIPESRAGRSRRASQLDVILLPLVGFDAAGGRLGMGGGFYDRALAFRRRRCGRRPWLIGLAHACQQVDRLALHSWDIPLDAVATDRGWFGRR